MDDIPLGILLGEIEDVDGTCGMCNVDNDVTNLPQSVCAFVYSQKLRDGRGSLGADLAR